MGKTNKSRAQGRELPSLAKLDIYPWTPPWLRSHDLKPRTCSRLRYHDLQIGSLKHLHHVLWLQSLILQTFKFSSLKLDQIIADSRPAIERLMAHALQTPFCWLLARTIRFGDGQTQIRSSPPDCLIALKSAQQADCQLSSTEAPMKTCHVVGLL